MEWNIVNEVAALQRLSVGQLRQRFAELFLIHRPPPSLATEERLRVTK